MNHRPASSRRRGGECCTALNRHFQILGRAESDFFACLDLDCFAGCRIAPHTCRSLPDLQDAETRNTDTFALLEMLRNQANELAEQGFTCLFRQLMLLGQDRGKMLECNWTLGFRCSGRCLCFG